MNIYMQASRIEEKGIRLIACKYTPDCVEENLNVRGSKLLEIMWLDTHLASLCTC